MSSSSEEQLTEDLSHGNDETQKKKRRRKVLKRRGPRLTGVSKQRKKANARERNRVNILNNYIQLLRTLIPESEKRATKFDVIIGAATYISQLTSILQEDEKTESMDARDLFELDCWLDSAQTELRAHMVFMQDKVLDLGYNTNIKEFKDEFRVKFILAQDGDS